MTDLATLNALLSRVLEAKGPDREIDALIWIWETSQRAAWEDTKLLAIDADGRTRVIGAIDPGVHSRNFGLWGYERTVPTYTASTDAALALVERRFPDACATLHGPYRSINIPSPVPNFCWAEFIYGFPGVMSPRGWGATKALAIVAALLRAEIAKLEATGSAAE